MASVTNFALTPKFRGEFHVDEYNKEAAEKTSDLLQHNLENYGMMFMHRRHNHISHQLLTSYALGASPDQLQASYERNTSYQIPKPPIHEDKVKLMQDKKRFSDFLHDSENYSSYLAFFQRQIEERGIESVLDEHLFADDEHARELLGLWYGGIIHPVIHMGFAMEFDQPALMAEALAQACVHEEPDCSLLTAVLLDAEKKSAGIGASSKKSLSEIFDDVRSHRDLREACLHTQEEQLDKVKGILEIVPEQLVDLASQYTVATEDLQTRMVEMANILSCSAALAQPPPRPYKVDFFFMHSLNALIFLPALSRTSWVSDKNKLRLFEWFGRYNIVLYASRGAPKITADAIVCESKKLQDWPTIFNRAIDHPTDDGHFPKIIRALKFAEAFTAPLKQEGTLLIRDDMWLRLANMINDSVPDTAVESHERWEYAPLVSAK